MSAQERRNSPANGQWSQFELGAAKEGRKDRRPKPISTIVTGENSSVSDAIAQQRQTIVDMLKSDLTGTGKVVVLVDNPLYAPLYAKAVSTAVAENTSFREAEREVFRNYVDQNPAPADDMQHIDPIDAFTRKVKTPHSIATGAMIDELVEQFPGRIRIQTHEAPHHIGLWLMRQKLGIVKREGVTPLDELSDDERKAEQIKIYRYFYKSFRGAVLDRDIATAKAVERSLAADDVIGVVAGLDIKALGITTILEGKTHADGAKVHTVATAIPADLQLSEEETLVLKAKNQQLTPTDLENAYDDDEIRKADDKRFAEQTEAAIGRIFAHYDDEVAQAEEALAMDLFATGLLAVEGSIPQEPSIDARIQRIKQRAKQVAPDVTKAFLQFRNNRTPLPKSVADLSGGIADRLVEIQMSWEKQMYYVVEQMLINSPEPNADAVISTRAVVERKMLEYFSDICGTKITDKDEISAAIGISQFTDPVGFAARVQQVKLRIEQDKIPLDISGLEIAGLSVAFATDDRQYGFTDESAKKTYLFPDPVAEALTDKILKRRGYEDAGQEEINRHSDDIRGHIDELKEYYDGEVESIIAASIDAIGDPTPEQRVQVMVDAQARVLTTMGSIAFGEDTAAIDRQKATTRELAEAMLQSAITDPQAYKERYTTTMNTGSDVNDDLVQKTVSVATGTWIPVEKQTITTDAIRKFILDLVGHDPQLVKDALKFLDKREHKVDNSQDGSQTVGSHRSTTDKPRPSGSPDVFIVGNNGEIERITGDNQSDEDRGEGRESR